MAYTHKQLVDIAYKWVLKNASCGVAFKEFVSLAVEQPDVIGFGSGNHSFLIECKISRSDFLADKKKPFRLDPKLGMGSHRSYCCPDGLIKVDELPDNWGLIYVNEKGKARQVYSPYKGSLEYHMKKFEKNESAELAVMYSALRRLQIRGRIDEVYQGLPSQEYYKKQLMQMDEQEKTLTTTPPNN